MFWQVLGSPCYVELIIRAITLTTKDIVYTNFGYWGHCEFCPTFAYLETLVFKTKVVQAYCSVFVYDVKMQFMPNHAKGCDICTS